MVCRGILYFLIFSLTYREAAHAVVHGTVVPAGTAQDVVKILYVENREKKEPLVVNFTGVFMTPSIVLTAGHTVSGITEKGSFAAVANNDKEFLKTAIRGNVSGIYTEYEDEAFMTKKIHPNDIKCWESKKEYDSTKTLDLALIKFPAESKFVATLDSNYVPAVGDDLTYMGYGLQRDPLVDMEFSDLLDDPLDSTKRFGEGKVWRTKYQSFAMKNAQWTTFAAEGDSGGPVFHNGKVVGILSTFEAHCERGKGDDFGVVNAVTLLSTPEAQAFIQRGLAHLSH